MCLLHLTGLNMWPLILSGWKRGRSCMLWINVGNTKTTITHSSAANCRFILSCCWLEYSKRASRDTQTVRLKLAGAKHSEAWVLPYISKGAWNLQIFTRLCFTISYLLSLLTKRPQAYKKNAFKSFIIFCYLVRKFHFSRLKTRRTNTNTWILWHCFLTSPQCKIVLWMKTILIQFIFLLATLLFSKPFLPTDLQIHFHSWAVLLSLF